MHRVYFSHSYRDVSINSHFLEYFVESDVALMADQKSKVWCVAKLERYMLESSGFVSIIPRRVKDAKIGYSEYIGFELSLARRSRVPRILFVDRAVRDSDPDGFPKDAFEFDRDDLKAGRSLHRRAIREFVQKLRVPDVEPLARRTRKTAAVIAPDSDSLLRAGKDVAALLATADYEVLPFLGQVLSNAYDDVRILEALRRSDVCVFLLGERLSYAHVVLGMAHAHCIPSLRLRLDQRVEDVETGVNGVIRCRDIDALLDEFAEQLSDFGAGMTEPVTEAKKTSAEEALQKTATSRRHEMRRWNLGDPRGLMDHIEVEHPFVKDTVTRCSKVLGMSLGTASSREDSHKVCRQLYDDTRERSDFVYELEPAGLRGETQAIRPPGDLEVNNAATCIDLACFFAALLQCAYRNAVVVVLQGESFAHALVGYRDRSEPPWRDARDRPFLIGAVQRGDAVLFETTGVAYSERVVGGETSEERRLGNGRLDFQTAKAAAKRLLERNDLEVRFVLDVDAARRSS